MRRMATQVLEIIMLIPFGIFVVNGIRASFIYALRLSEEPFYILANGSPSFFYLFEVLAIVVTTFFLLWIWRRYWRRTNWWLMPIFFLGIIGSYITGTITSGLLDPTGLQYIEKRCGAYLSDSFSVAAQKQDVSFCTSPHDYARVNTYEGFKGGDFCELPGGNTVRIMRERSNEYDPIFSKYCMEALAVQATEPNLCFELKSSAEANERYDYDFVDPDVVQCIENYAGKNKDITSCELLTRDERNHCIFHVALWGTQSIRTCVAIDTDSKWKNDCLERMADGKP